MRPGSAGARAPLERALHAGIWSSRRGALGWSSADSAAGLRLVEAREVPATPLSRHAVQRRWRLRSAEGHERAALLGNRVYPSAGAASRSPGGAANKMAAVAFEVAL